VQLILDRKTELVVPTGKVQLSKTIVFW